MTAPTMNGAELVESLRRIREAGAELERSVRLGELAVRDAVDRLRVPASCVRAAAAVAAAGAELAALYFAGFVGAVRGVASFGAELEGVTVDELEAARLEVWPRDDEHAQADDDDAPKAAAS